MYEKNEKLKTSEKWDKKGKYIWKKTTRALQDIWTV